MNIISQIHIGEPVDPIANAVNEICLENESHKSILELEVFFLLNKGVNTSTFENSFEIVTKLSDNSLEESKASKKKVLDTKDCTVTSSDTAIVAKSTKCLLKLKPSENLQPKCVEIENRESYYFFRSVEWCLLDELFRARKKEIFEGISKELISKAKILLKNWIENYDGYFTKTLESSDRVLRKKKIFLKTLWKCLRKFGKSSNENELWDDPVLNSEVEYCQFLIGQIFPSKKCNQIEDKDKKNMPNFNHYLLVVDEHLDSFISNHIFKFHYESRGNICTSNGNFASQHRWRKLKSLKIIVSHHLMKSAASLDSTSATLERAIRIISKVEHSIRDFYINSIKKITGRELKKSLLMTELPKKLLNINLADIPNLQKLELSQNCTAFIVELKKLRNDSLMLYTEARTSLGIDRFTQVVETIVASLPSNFALPFNKNGQISAVSERIAHDYFAASQWKKGSGIEALLIRSDNFIDYYHTKNHDSSDEISLESVFKLPYAKFLKLRKSYLVKKWIESVKLIQKLLETVEIIMSRLEKMNMPEENVMVATLIDRERSTCVCERRFPMTRIEDFKYYFGPSDRIYLVRFLNNHVMIRVGGGWEELHEFLQKRDPCRKMRI